MMVAMLTLLLMLTTETMNMMMIRHLCQGVANDDIQLTIVYKNLVITDDDDKRVTLQILKMPQLQPDEH